MHPDAHHYLTAAAIMEAAKGPNPYSSALKSAALSTPAPMLSDAQCGELDTLQEQIADAESNGQWAKAGALKSKLLGARKAFGL